MADEPKTDPIEDKIEPKMDPKPDPKPDTKPDPKPVEQINIEDLKTSYAELLKRSDTLELENKDLQAKVANYEAERLEEDNPVKKRLLEVEQEKNELLRQKAADKVAMEIQKSISTLPLAHERAATILESLLKTQYNFKWEKESNRVVYESPDSRMPLTIDNAVLELKKAYSFLFKSNTNTASTRVTGTQQPTGPYQPMMDRPTLTPVQRAEAWSKVRSKQN